MYIGIPLFETWGCDVNAHVTIAFNGYGESKSDYLNAVCALADTCRWWHGNGNGLVDLEYGDTQCFDEVVWHAPVTSKKLFRFRARLIQNLDQYKVYYSKEYEYTPHVTLNYGTEPMNNPYAGNSELVRQFSVNSRAFGQTIIRV